MKKVITTTGILLCLLAIVLLLLPSVAWDGGVHRTFKITVLDSATESPIEGVELFILREHDYEILKLHEEGNQKEMFMEHMKGHGIGISDSLGIVETGRQFGAGGSSGPFMKRGSFYVSGRLKLKKEGYKDFEGLLENTLGAKHFPLSKKHFEFTIYLERKTEPVGELVNASAADRKSENHLHD